MSKTSLISLGGGGGGSPDISFALSIVDQPLDGQIITIAIPSYLTVTIDEAMAGSNGKASVQAAAQADFDVQKNGASVGTIRFGATETSPSFIMASETEFDGSSGDYLTIVCPNPADATLANIGITIKGTKS
jgi:hypothetical protein